MAARSILARSPVRRHGVAGRTRAGPQAQYQLWSCSGEVGMAPAVFRAEHVTAAWRRPVAVKVIDPALSAQPDFQRRFYQEAQRSRGSSTPTSCRSTTSAITTASVTWSSPRPGGRPRRSLPPRRRTSLARCPRPDDRPTGPGRARPRPRPRRRPPRRQAWQRPARARRHVGVSDRLRDRAWSRWSWPDAAGTLHRNARVRRAGAGRGPLWCGGRPTCTPSGSCSTSSGWAGALQRRQPHGDRLPPRQWAAAASPPSEPGDLAGARGGAGARPRARSRRYRYPTGSALIDALAAVVHGARARRCRRRPTGPDGPDGRAGDAAGRPTAASTVPPDRPGDPGSADHPDDQPAGRGHRLRRPRAGDDRRGASCSTLACGCSR